MLYPNECIYFDSSCALLIINIVIMIIFSMFINTYLIYMYSQGYKAFAFWVDKSCNI